MSYNRDKLIDISVVTISFNQKKYLEKCISSITQQKGVNFEYIIVDPGSTDGSRELISKYSNKIDKIILEKDTGPANGLNKGFSGASGRYLVYINADDFLLAGTLRKILKILHSRSFPKLLLCGGWLVDENDLPKCRMYSTRFSKQGLVTHRTSLFQQGMVIDRLAFEAIGGFNESNHSCWDYELLVSLVRSGVWPVISSERVAAFRVHNESISGGAYGTEMREVFAADLRRIFKDAKLAFEYLSPSKLSFWARIEKYLRTPEVSINVAFDRMFPWMLEKRWERDLRAGELANLDD